MKYFVTQLFKSENYEQLANACSCYYDQLNDRSSRKI